MTVQQVNMAYFSDIVRALNTRVSRYAYIGLAIALIAVLVATVATAALAGPNLTLDSLAAAQRGNVTLWILDIMPFVFAFWGQYVSVVLSHEAGALVLDQTQSLRTDNAALKEQARRVSELDTLTGLFNRARFIELVDEEIAAAHLSRARIGVMVLDLDGFSEVNEQHGVANGDRVIKSVARRLTMSAPEPAVIGRLAGDRFGVLIAPLQAPDLLAGVGRRIQRAMEPPCTLDTFALNLGSSIGAAVYPDNAHDSHGMISAAEGAMHQAKTRGGGFEMVRSRRPLQDAEMHSLSSELRAAIDNGQLLLHLQPLVDASADRVHGVEALVRWQHPRRGLIMPGDFIPRAERSGLMDDLSNWVLRQALQYAAMLRRSGRPLRISVNLSARSLLNPDFPDVLAGLLAAYDLPSKFLILEITEDTLMADQQRTLDIITRVANIGVQISIDDFGTGYSQLAYLKRLPASEIKIDRSFVQDMLVSRTDLSIVQATIGLAHALNLRAVGEGIESAAHADRLRQLGCDLMQGFYIGRPMPIEKLGDWLDQWHLDHAATASGASKTVSAPSLIGEAAASEESAIDPQRSRSLN